jgi:hypothetical protein
MSADRYICCDERRRALLLAPEAPAEFSGIDYIEVEQGATTADPTIIDIVLVKPLPLPAAVLTGANIALTGGVRFRTPQIDPAVQALPGGGSVERYRIVVPGGQPTDFSTYRLALIGEPGSSEPPSFIDPRLSSVDFSFKVGCPSEFDCAPDCPEDEGPLPPEPLFDYRVRDFPGFRRLMLDRMAALVPGFREDDPLDLTTTLVELAAYRADQQSYRLDWVGTEAFLSTARSRTSIARHVRLVDYAPGEGASARVFVSFTFRPGNGIADGLRLEQSTPLLVRAAGLPPVVPSADYRRVLAQEPIVFETVARARIWEWRNAIALHTWGDEICRLPKGATAATLVDRSNGNGGLAPGDFVLFAETRSPETGAPEDARPERRHVVRLTRVEPATDILFGAIKLVSVTWEAADALPFDLIVQARRADALGGADLVTCAEATANIVIADHGASFPPAEALGLPPSDVAALRPNLSPDRPPGDEPWRPVLDRADISRVEPVELEGAPRRSAAALAGVDPSRSLPVFFLDDDFSNWQARRDLLESGPFDRAFVIETAMGGWPTIRFGDGIHGLQPPASAVFSPRGRFGCGPEGNIGPESLAHVVLPLTAVGADLAVTNPLPGRGGAAPESISDIRIAAPQAFRRQERAVTAEDYARAARRHPEVLNAVAVPRWTGAWQTILIFIDRRAGLPVDEGFRRALLAHIEHDRLMGFDVALRSAVMAPLDIELRVCALPGRLRSAVSARVREALRPVGVGGHPGFFHPDNFTFGAPLYLSRLVAAVMAVEGVQSVQALKFQRLGRLPANEIAEGVIRPNDVEVLQLSDDPSFPEQGRLVLQMGGGR